MANDRRVALVTGGAKRVGRAIVEKLASKGFAVVFTYLNSENEATKLATQINGSEVCADLTKPDQASEHIRHVFTKYSDHLDLLVNCASIYRPDPEEFDASFVSNLFKIHYESPLRLIERFKSSLQQSRGHIVNMVDILAERPWPKYKTYCASKAALANLTLSLARELAPDVTVNGIAPGVVEWPAGYPEDEKQNYLKRVPLARAGSPEDVANLVHFLATEGSYITGQIIRLDGGRSVT